MDMKKKELDPNYVMQLKNGIEALSLTLNESQITKLIEYIQILIKWNRVYNLTAITTIEKVITHHILDSLGIIPFISGQRVIDIGSGAGLPGIPCAIALPDKQFVLLDSNGKKTRFMTQAIGQLALKNTEVVQARVEQYKVDDCFDTITVRAFSSLENILALTEHLLCANGDLLIMKGTYPSVELQKINRHAKVYPLTIPGLQEQRHLVCIKRALP